MSKENDKQEPITRRLLASSTFRLTLLYIIMLCVSVTVVLGFVYWSTAGYMSAETDRSIEAEIAHLEDRYTSAGVRGLVKTIRELISRNPYGSTIYLLVDNKLRNIAGNLDRWPIVTSDVDGWVSFEVGANERDGQVHYARARSFILKGGFRLLVGRDMFEFDSTRSRIIEATIWGVIITLVLALLGGILMSKSTFKRLELINATSREIIDGDLSRRIPYSNRKDDYDELANNLNTMLDRIQSLMESMRQVTDNIAHDLKTPLTRLRNRLESLCNEPNNENAEKALEEADAMLATFHALLRISWIESGKTRRAFVPTHLDDILKDVVNFYEPLAEEKRQLLVANLSGDPSILGDRDLLFQAFANLVDNAIKYTPESGAIRISMHSSGSGVKICIQDNGLGIPDHERERVFHRFVRLEKSRQQVGNGLGLSLVSAVVKLHDARIRLENANPGLKVVIEWQEKIDREKQPAKSINTVKGVPDKAA